MVNKLESTIIQCIGGTGAGELRNNDSWWSTGGIMRDDVEGGVFYMVAKFQNFNGQGLRRLNDKEWNNTDRMVESSIEQNQEMIN